MVVIISRSRIKRGVDADIDAVGCWPRKTGTKLSSCGWGLPHGNRLRRCRRPGWKGVYDQGAM